MSTHLESIKLTNTIIITGNITINLIPRLLEQHYECNNRLTYLNMLSTHGISPGLLKPTRVNSYLDHFMIKMNNNQITASTAVLSASITDHCTIFLSLATRIVKSPTTKIKVVNNYGDALFKLQE